jgi:hypothetical protein
MPVQGLFLFLEEKCVPKEGFMIASKTDVWVEFVALLRDCPTQLHRHTAVACLLTHLFDDEEADNQLLIDSIQRAHRSLAGSIRKPCRSVGMRGWIEQM